MKIRKKLMGKDGGPLCCGNLRDPPSVATEPLPKSLDRLFTWNFAFWAIFAIWKINMLNFRRDKIKFTGVLNGK